MSLTLAIAKQLLLLLQGQQLPASKLKHALVKELIDEGIITERLNGRTKSTLLISDTTAFNNWLYNKEGIDDLPAYVEVMTNDDATRADNILVSNDSKAKSVKTYKGFLVNSYAPIECTLYGRAFTVHPQPGSFQFIYDFEQFVPPADAVIVGVENFSNFRFVDLQQHLFTGMKTLFVCRYPQEQGKHLIQWLQQIPNAYLHFGDLDFAGINIYLQEYKVHLQDRATFFIPGNVEPLLAQYGNRKLYDQQQLNSALITEPHLQQLITLIHLHKKGLEQEVFLAVGG